MNNWKTLLIHSNTTMSETIKVLDKGAQRIALVVDAANQLLGTVTDGDIRRALIAYLSMDTPAADVMCKTPKTGCPEWSKSLILSTMEKYQLLQLPIVDNKKRVIGLETLQDILKTKHRDNIIFLMAGGFGSRLYPLTQHCPKPLLKVGKKPILEVILERFIEAGFYRFYISTHYMHHMIEEYFKDGSQWGVSIEYVYEETPLGTGGALGLLPHHKIDLPVLMMNADLLTHLNFESLLSFHEEHPALATMCVREYEHIVPYGVVQGHDHHVVSMAEKPVHRFFINAGIYLLSSDLVRSVKPGIPLDMPTLLEQQIAAGHTVNMFPIHEYWLDIGRMEDFKLAQHEFETT
jgi:dTDP-glucose pyrophosphorylase